MTENWKQQLQKKMDSLETAAPELAWSDIDKALAKKARQKATTVPLWTKRIVAAAAVALIAIAGAKLIFDSEEQYSTNAPQRSLTSRQTTSQTANTLKERMESVRELAVAEKTKAVTSVGTSVASPDVAEQLSIELPTVEETVTTTEEKKEVKKQEKTTGKLSVANQDYRYMALTDNPAPQRKRQSQRGMSADLHVDGLMGSNNSTANGGIVANNYMMSDAQAYGNGEMQMQGFSYPLMTLNRRELSYDHDLPIKVGVSLRYNIDERWSIVAGVNYSYLHSTFTVNGNTDHGGSQKLHYIGIPLAASLNIWKNEKMKLYVTAGGTAEKLLKGTVNEKLPSGKTESSDLKESRLQWSLQGAAGMEYNLTPTLGIYLEPGVSHHFNNHSDIQNIYKDKPWNFNLNFGLRWNIK